MSPPQRDVGRVQIDDRIRFGQLPLSKRLEVRDHLVGDVRDGSAAIFIIVERFDDVGDLDVRQSGVEQFHD